jgi:hypothetical protein
VIYLVILVLVGAAGITRLLLLQRRKDTQMDTIEGFYSALEAMSPLLPARGRHSTRSARRVTTRRPARRGNLIAGWFVTRPPQAERARRTVVRRKIEARRAAPSRRYQVTRLHPRHVSTGNSQHERFAG